METKNEYPTLDLDPVAVQYLLEYWDAGLTTSPVHATAHRVAARRTATGAPDIQSIVRARDRFRLWQLQQKSR